MKSFSFGLSKRYYHPAPIHMS